MGDDVKSKLERSLSAVGQRVLPGSAAVTLERPRDASHGDYATNFALVAAKGAGRKPRDVAEAFVELAREQPDVQSFTASMSIAGLSPC